MLVVAVNTKQVKTSYLIKQRIMKIPVDAINIFQYFVSAYYYSRGSAVHYVKIHDGAICITDPEIAIIDHINIPNRPPLNPKNSL